MCVSFLDNHYFHLISVQIERSHAIISDKCYRKRRSVIMLRTLPLATFLTTEVSNGVQDVDSHCNGVEIYRIWKHGFFFIATSSCCIQRLSRMCFKFAVLQCIVRRICRLTFTHLKIHVNSVLVVKYTRCVCPLIKKLYDHP